MRPSGLFNSQLTSESIIFKYSWSDILDGTLAHREVSTGAGQREHKINLDMQPPHRKQKKISGYTDTQIQQTARLYHKPLLFFKKLEGYTNRHTATQQGNLISLPFSRVRKLG